MRYLICTWQELDKTADLGGLKFQGVDVLTFLVEHICAWQELLILVL